MERSSPEERDINRVNGFPVSGTKFNHFLLGTDSLRKKSQPTNAGLTKILLPLGLAETRFPL